MTCSTYDDEWPSPNRDGPVIPRYSPSGRQLGCWNNDFATTTTTPTGGGQRRLRLRRGPISFFSTRCLREKNLLIPAAAGFFSLDATLGLLATRRRLGRLGDFSAMRSAFVV